MNKNEYTLNEKDTLTDLVGCQKNIVKLYASAITETTVKQLRDMFKTNMLEAASDHLSVSNAMTDRNYFMAPEADKHDIETIKKSNKSTLSELNNK